MISWIKVPAWVFTDYTPRDPRRAAVADLYGLAGSLAWAPQSLSERFLSVRWGMPKSNVRRLLLNLEERGAIRRIGGAGPRDPAAIKVFEPGQRTTSGARVEHERTNLNGHGTLSEEAEEPREDHERSGAGPNTLDTLDTLELDRLRSFVKSLPRVGDRALNALLRRGVVSLASLSELNLVQLREVVGPKTADKIAIGIVAAGGGEIRGFNPAGMVRITPPPTEGFSGALWAAWITEWKTPSPQTEWNVDTAAIWEGVVIAGEKLMERGWAADNVINRVTELGAWAANKTTGRGPRPGPKELKRCLRRDYSTNRKPLTSPNKERGGRAGSNRAGPASFIEPNKPTNQSIVINGHAWELN